MWTKEWCRQLDSSADWANMPVPGCLAVINMADKEIQCEWCFKNAKVSVYSWCGYTLHGILKLK